MLHKIIILALLFFNHNYVNCNEDKRILVKYSSKIDIQNNNQKLIIKNYKNEYIDEEKNIL